MKKRILCMILSICFVLSTAGCSLFEGDPRPDFPYQYLTFNTYSSLAEFPVTADEQYHYFFSGHFICSLDKKTNELRPVCSKPGCLHDKAEDGDFSQCNAYVESGMALSFIQLYEGWLYFIKGRNRWLEGSEILMRLSADGASREEVAPLNLTTEETPNSVLEFAGIHRGWFYTVSWSISPAISASFDAPHRMQRIAIDNPDAGAEPLFDIQAYSINAVPFGGHFYISIQKGEDRKSVILDYDIKKNRLSEILADKKVIGIHQGKLALEETLPPDTQPPSEQTKLFLYDPANGGTSAFMTLEKESTGSRSIFTDDHYVYVHDLLSIWQNSADIGKYEQSLTVYDTKQSVVFNKKLPGGSPFGNFIAGEECAMIWGSHFSRKSDTLLKETASILKFSKEDGFHPELIQSPDSMGIDMITEEAVE